jgi:hypothetical protein
VSSFAAGTTVEESGGRWYSVEGVHMHVGEEWCWWSFSSWRLVV